MGVLGNNEFTGLTAVLRRVLDRWARNKAPNIHARHGRKL